MSGAILTGWGLLAEVALAVLGLRLLLMVILHALIKNVGRSGAVTKFLMKCIVIGEKRLTKNL